MFTVVAYSESQDPAGIMEKMTAVEDQHVKTSGDKITIPDLNQIIGAYAALGTVPDKCRLISPSLRRTNPLYITPVELALVPSLMPRMLYRGDNPIPLDVDEDLEVENNANPAGAEQQSVVVFLGDGAVNKAVGQILTVNCTVTAVLVAGAWAFSEIIFPDSLPIGDYDIVGARAVVATGVAFRFVPVGAAHRPGGICSLAVNGVDPWAQRNGRLGVWASFKTIQPPGIEILGSAAVGSTTYQVFMDLIKK